MQNGYGHSGYDLERKRNERLQSTDTSSETWKQENDNDSFSKFRERSMTSVKKNSGTSLLKTFPSSISHRDVNVKANTAVATFVQESAFPSSAEVIGNSKHKKLENAEQSEARAISADDHVENAVNSNSVNSLHHHATRENELLEDNEQIYDPLSSMVSIEENREIKDMGSDDYIMEDMMHFPENRLVGNVFEDAMEGQATVMSEKALLSSKKAQRVKSVRINSSVERNGEIYAGEKELNPEIPHVSQEKGELSEWKSRIEIPFASKKEGELGGVIEPKTELQADSGDEWKTTIEMLREELREAAATEVGLYSIVAEHASSVNKVHTPARRLSRFYVDACKEGSQARRASAARAAVSGLVLVSKSCGHDVPR